MFFRFACSGLALIGTANAAASPAAPTIAAHRPQSLKLEPFLKDHLSLRVRIGGYDRLLLFDTAGALTSVSKEVAATIGCKPWGQVTGFQMRGGRITSPKCDDVRFSVAGRPTSVLSASVDDLSKFFPKDAPKLDGLLALDAFDGEVVTLDLSRKLLIVETPSSAAARAAKGQQVMVRLAREVQGAALVAAIGVQSAVGTLWLEIDSGSDGAFVLGRHAAAALGLPDKEASAKDLSLPVARGAKLSGNARIEDLIIDGNVGNRVLRQWILTLDLKRGRGWIAPAV